MYLIRRIRTGAVCLLLAAAGQGAAQVPPAGQPRQTPLSPLTVTELDEPSRGQALDSPRPITLTVAQDTPIGDLLLMLVRGTQLGVVPDPDVAGTFRGELKDVTLREALEMVLQPLGLDYTVHGNVIRVFRRRVETRRFDVNYVVTRRTASRRVVASSPAPPNAPAGNATARAVTGEDAGDVFDDLTSGVRTLLSPEGRFNLDRKAALLQVTDYPERLDQVQLYLDAVERRATQQVQIAARVLEIELRDEFAAGIDWNLLVKQAGGAIGADDVSPTAQATWATRLRVRDFGRLLQAFGEQGAVNVLASPVVSTLNNEPVLMRSATLVLSVTPQIGADGVISMNVSPTVTRPGSDGALASGATGLREADTLVRVRDSETAVIAGLLDDRVRLDEHRMPVLGGLPGIGGLFRGERATRHKSDLVILLTPTVMTPARHARPAAEKPEH